MPTQNIQIYNYLSTGKKLTGLKALNLFGSIKCSNRIGEIEKAFKVSVSREWIIVNSKHGQKRVVEYSLKDYDTRRTNKKA